jgi:cation transport regulator ChaC
MKAMRAAKLVHALCRAHAHRTKNVNWLGAASLNEVAQQIARAHGPSGPNSEYLYRLADTMRKVRAGSWSPVRRHAQLHRQLLPAAQGCG